MVVVAPLDDSSGYSIGSSVGTTVPSVAAYPMKGIWVDADAVRNAPRVYSYSNLTEAAGL